MVVIAYPTVCTAIRLRVLRYPIRLSFERDAAAKLPRHNQAHRLSVKRLSRVDSQFVSPLESKFGLKHTGNTPLDLNPENHISEG